MTSPHFFKRFDCYDNTAFVCAGLAQDLGCDVDWQRVAAMADHSNEPVPMPLTYAYIRIPHESSATPPPLVEDADHP